MEEIEIRGRTFTRDDFRMPEDYTAPKAPKQKLPTPANTRTIQKQLAALGYLPSSAVTGKYDYRTHAGRDRLPGLGGPGARRHRRADDAKRA